MAVVLWGVGSHVNVPGERHWHPEPNWEQLGHHETDELKKYSGGWEVRAEKMLIYSYFLLDNIAELGPAVCTFQRIETL